MLFRSSAVALLPLLLLAATSSPTNARDDCENKDTFRFNGNDDKDCKGWVSENPNKRCKKDDPVTGKKVQSFCPLFCKEKCKTSNHQQDDPVVNVQNFNLRGDQFNLFYGTAGNIDPDYAPTTEVGERTQVTNWGVVKDSDMDDEYDETTTASYHVNIVYNQAKFVGGNSLFDGGILEVQKQEFTLDLCYPDTNNCVFLKYNGYLPASLDVQDLYRPNGLTFFAPFVASVIGGTGTYALATGQARVVNTPNAPISNPPNSFQFEVTLKTIAGVGADLITF
mmetsp:Transcript_10643/g.12052  ORF Transcript_10643/g.12052 Transcript_10643/m.12052 type:complete len:280 (-) Transcript_10643:40-879(-)